MTTDPLFAPLRQLLQRQIERSTPARSSVAALDGRTLAIRLRGTGLAFFLSVAAGELAMSREFAAEPDVILETTPLGLADLARGSLSGGQVAMTGDPAVAEHFRTLLQHTRPDWEEELARVIGDVAAHQFGNAFRGLVAFGQRAAESFSRSTAEFVQEERRDIAAPGEIDAFRERVSAVAAKVESVGRRLDELIARTR